MEGERRARVERGRKREVRGRYSREGNRRREREEGRVTKWTRKDSCKDTDQQPERC